MKNKNYGTFVSPFLNNYKKVKENKHIPQGGYYSWEEDDEHTLKSASISSNE